MWDEFIPVSLIAELVFCPRNFYYRACEGENTVNRFVVEGNIKDEKRKERERLRTQEKLQVKEITLSSERLGIIGVLDAVENDGEIYPIEYKRGYLKESLSDDVQLCLEALLLEEHVGKTVQYGYIYYYSSRVRRRVEFSHELRNKSIEAIDKAREILYRGEIPEPVADTRCHGCSLLSVCLPFETRFIKEKGEKPKRIITELNTGRILYVDEHGAYIGKRGGKITVTKDGKVITEIPASYLRQLIISANANISTQALKFLLRLNVDIVYQSTFGRFEGKFVPEENKNSLLRIEQYRRHIDRDFTLEVSKSFVKGKLLNMRTLLLRQNREFGNREIDEACIRIKNVITRIPDAGDKEELLGLEGIATRDYFRVFGKLLKPKLDFDFEKRTKRPPRDPVNALLSFGYSLLVGNFISTVSTVGFDPYIGFLHSTRYGRPALALDLMEEFRPVIVDSLVLSVLNRNMFTKEDFKERFGGIYIQEKGRETFFKAYIGKIQSEILHPIFEYRVSYRRAFEIQARLLAKFIKGEIEEYIPFALR